VGKRCQLANSKLTMTNNPFVNERANLLFLGRVLIKASAEPIMEIRFTPKSGHASVLGLMSAKCHERTFLGQRNNSTHGDPSRPRT